MPGSEGDRMQSLPGKTLCPSAPVWPLDLVPKGSLTGRLVFLLVPPTDGRVQHRHPQANEVTPRSPGQLPAPLPAAPSCSPREPLASGSLLPGFSQLVLEGRFLEACRSISSSAEERQDRGCQYQVVAQGMWQVVQEALEGSGGGRELQRKLRSVAAAMEWARGASRELGGDLASWDCQLQTRLRNDAENRVPPSPRDRVPLNLGDQLGRYLAELAEAMDRGLGPQRAALLGACLSATDRECFQEVLLGRLSVLLTRSGDPDSCRELYTWARKTLFGQLA